MRYVLLSLVIFSLVGNSGCGNKDLEDKIQETSSRLENVERELVGKVESVSGRLDKMKDDMTSTIKSADDDLAARLRVVEKSINDVKQALVEASDGNITFANIKEARSDDSEAKEELEKLKQEIVTLQAEFQKLKRQDPRTEASTMHDNWRDMGDPVKLEPKLDAFIEAYAPKLEEKGQRIEFEADMAAYKAEATKEYTTEELLQKQKETLEQQIAESDDDRMREWYNRQLKALDEADERSLESRLSNFRRYENMRALSKIAQKYGLSRTELREYKLQVYGGGWDRSER